MANNPLTYQCMDPRDFGRETIISAGKHSGAHGVQAILEKRGVRLPEESMRRLMAEVKQAGDEGKRISEDDLMAMAEGIGGALAQVP
jgi:D-citramalate synthase